MRTAKATDLNEGAEMANCSDANEEHIRTMVRVSAALAGAGVVRWTPSEQAPEGALLMGVTASLRRGWLWFQPHFTRQVVVVELPVEAAILAIQASGRRRLDAGADPDEWATKAEALALWDDLVHAAARAADVAMEAFS